MASVSPSGNTFGVTVRQVSGTSSSGLGSAFNVGSQAPVTGTALSTPGELLTVDILVENDRGTANSVTASVSDQSGSGAFFGEGTLDWNDGESGGLWIQFTGFPPQGDGSTPTGSCEYSLITSGDVVGARVFTV
ncbi:hypothetical protein [Streptomyces glaucescens]|uniref:Uncharacterized protein n=1 Tax=Streptomyces glaucescens TaxID=1907 RepID=A0A089XEX8_STRGA|nr:hypothetical protein [Streptomyces glaucescens]AIS00447.1 hypothetical protein SGLAU_22485 [Streptomyces glaucescens]